ncbi:MULTISPECIES: HNH endonuclease [unclassified Rhizobium]|uniref:HNH endonuclease n=1 Tax=unclassified Rhizobium TaxID=2613769 RepID=UPI0007F14223|nr:MULTISPECIES: HNH endonuclease [unclassified Rhizobium]ANK91520.1 HNH endonuclease protein [Rhizobium sp. N6212]ANK97553.1 HNH endonuclease protein [Rhizobium sp. N621]
MDNWTSPPDEQLTCYICGESLTPSTSSIHHLRPAYARGNARRERSNLLTICAACNSTSEHQFVAYLGALLTKHPDFSEIALDEVITGSRYRADLLASRKVKRRQKRLIIECKGFSEFTPQRVRATLDQLRRYAAISEDAQLVLAYPGVMDEATLEQFSKLQVEVWDALSIFDSFEEQIVNTPDTFFQQRLLEVRDRTSREQRLVNRLRNCPEGLEHWADYQKIVGTVLTHLFCGPLADPQVEHSDATKTNRRDFIFPNYAEGGFWRYLRDRYAADYIVVDAKNHATQIKKESVNQIGNYLKEAGVGKLGIIVCRYGPSKGANVTVREKWLLDGKLIIFVTNEDLEQMLLAKAAQGDPTRILTDIIQRFRLSI